MVRFWRTVALAREVIDDTGTKNAGLISAGVAFYGLFAIFPAIAAVIALFGLMADPAIVDTQLELMRGFMPPGVFALFESQIDRLLQAGGSTLGWATLLSLGLALWSARAGVAALVRGLNEIFERPQRGGVWHVVVALILTVSLVGISVVALLMVVVAPVVLAFVPYEADWTRTLDGIRWLVAVAVLLLGLGVLYRYGPNRRGFRLNWITPGAVLVVVCWLGVSAAFSVYVTNFASYNEVYGSLGAVIALLMWFYLTAYLILLGAALNMALDRERSRRDKRAGIAEIL